MFVDFLPWIWEEDKLAHTAKLYAALTEAERARLGRLVELGEGSRVSPALLPGEYLRK